MAVFAKTDVTQSQLIEFMKVCKEGLKLGLGSISLQLVDMELYHSPNKLVLDPRLTAWCLRCIIKNPITGQTKESRTNFQACIGDTTVETVKGMVVNIVEECRMGFYGK